MGWCSATEIFDVVAKDILDQKHLKDDAKRKILKNLINVLEDMDWDTLCESEYYKHPLVNKIIKDLHPDWFDDEVDDE